MSWLDTIEDVRKKDFKKARPKEREDAARGVVNMCSYACAVVAVAPIPFSDALLMLPIQSAMVVTVGHIYGRRVDSAAARDLLLEIGATAGLGILARQGIKAILPVLGALLTVPAAFAANWAIGRVAIEYFKNPGATREYLREVYARAKEEGSGLFSREKLDELRGAASPRAKSKPKSKSKPARARAAPTVEALIEEQLPARLAKKPKLAKDIGAVLHLDVTGRGGGQWTVDLTKRKGWVAKGLDGSPRMTVRCAAEDLVAIATGAKSAQTAILTGALVLEPMELELAAKVGRLFS